MVSRTRRREPLMSSVGLAAQLALAGALPRLDLACGLGTLSLLTADVVAASLRASDGLLTVPPTAPVPDQRLLEAYAHRDAGRADWWRDRVRRAHAVLRRRLAPGA